MEREEGGSIDDVDPSKSSVQTGLNLGSLAMPMSQVKNQNCYAQWLDQTWTEQNHQFSSTSSGSLCQLGTELQQPYQLYSHTHTDRQCVALCKTQQCKIFS